MGRLARSLSVIAVLATLALPSWTETPSIEGRWVLVEQTYGQGATNLAPRAPALHLDVATGLDAPRVLVWTGEQEARPWPAVPADGTPAVLEVLAKDVHADGLHSEYRLSPPSGIGWTLDMTESYALDPDSGELVGKLSVSMSREGEPRGSFVLHRRFERVSR